MILAKARLINDGNGRVRVGLSFPTGFDPEEVVEDSVRANGAIVPEAIHIDPRKGSLGDIYREFEVYFPSQVLSGAGENDGTLSITGRFRRGLPFKASIPIAPPHGGSDH